MSVESQTLATPSDETLLSEYEELRRMALGRSNGPRQGVGFTLLVRRGMAAWMEACATAARVSSQRSLPRREHGLIPPGLRGEVAMVLAAMALACTSEGGLTA